jgi:hypothetical protein
MSEDNNRSDPMHEQWSAYQKIWAETFTKMMQLGVNPSLDSAPPDFLRQIRGGIFQALAQSWDQFLRSPQFLETLRQWMDQAVAYRKMTNEFLHQVHQQTLTPSREDTDAVLQAVRQLEVRLRERLEEISSRVTELQRRIERLGPEAAPDADGSAEPPAGSASGARRRKRAS